MSKEFVIGEKVRVITLPPYLKTADPMPMLRPPEVVALGEEGIVSDRRRQIIGRYALLRVLF